MKSREFRKVYHPSLGRYVYMHRGNGLIVDNIMKPLKGAIGSAGRAGARAVKEVASKVFSRGTAKKAAKAATAKCG